MTIVDGEPVHNTARRAHTGSRVPLTRFYLISYICRQDGVAYLLCYVCTVECISQRLSQFPSSVQIRGDGHLAPFTHATKHQRHSLTHLTQVCEPFCRGLSCWRLLRASWIFADCTAQKELWHFCLRSQHLVMWRRTFQSTFSTNFSSSFSINLLYPKCILCIPQTNRALLSCCCLHLFFPHMVLETRSNMKRHTYHK
jgi:hypothetical protein